MDRAIKAYAGDVHENRVQEMRELGCAHFATSHRELTRLDQAKTADMSVDWDIVGRISKYDSRALFSHQNGVA